MARRTEIERHLTEAELDAAIDRTDDARLLRRLLFVKNLYRGDTLAEAAERVGRSQPTGGRWAARWNEGGVDALAPDHGGGRPPRLDADERAALASTLADGGARTIEEVRTIIERDYGVSYHPNYVYELLRRLDVELPDGPS